MHWWLPSAVAKMAATRPPLLLVAAVLLTLAAAPGLAQQVGSSIQPVDIEEEGDYAGTVESVSGRCMKQIIWLPSCVPASIWCCCSLYCNKPWPLPLATMPPLQGSPTPVFDVSLPQNASTTELSVTGTRQRIEAAPMLAPDTCIWVAVSVACGASLTQSLPLNAAAAGSSGSPALYCSLLGNSTVSSNDDVPSVDNPSTDYRGGGHSRRGMQACLQVLLEQTLRCLCAPPRCLPPRCPLCTVRRAGLCLAQFSCWLSCQRCGHNALGPPGKYFAAVLVCNAVWCRAKSAAAERSHISRRLWEFHGSQVPLGQRIELLRPAS